MNDPRFDAEWTNAVYLFVTRDFREEIEKFEKTVNEQSKANRDGWKLVADAIRDGLGSIAKAIADRR